MSGKGSSNDDDHDDDRSVINKSAENFVAFVVRNLSLRCRLVVERLIKGPARWKNAGGVFPFHSPFSITASLFFRSATPAANSRDEAPVERRLCVEREGQQPIYHPSCKRTAVMAASKELSSLLTLDEAV